MRSDRYTDSPSEQPHEKTTRRRRSGTLRILILIIILLIAAIAAVVRYSYNSAFNSLSVTFTDDDMKVEAGSELKALDCVSTHTGTIKASQEYLSTDAPGTYELTYRVSQEILGGLLGELLVPEKEFTLTYEVTDSVPPLMLWSGDGTVIEKGSDFDIGKVISYGDNADSSPSLDVKGKVDTSSVGSYPLHVTVTDASGNETEWDLTVRVAESVPSYSGSTAGTPFSDFALANSGEGAAFGIDVSTWQGDIDFDAVKKAGCEFVIIRIGYSVDGVVEMDDKFEQNYERAEKAGLKVGIYLFSYDNTEEEVRASAKWIADKLGGDSLELPVAFDWENFGQFQQYEISFNELNKLYDAFADELKAGGYECMLYGSKLNLENVWSKRDIRPVWLAHYTDKTDYADPYMMWQASCTGRIDGIDGDVDMDILYSADK